MQGDDKTINRRQLLKGAMAATAAGALGPFFPGKVLGANDRVNMAIIGIRGQGGAHVNGFAKIPNVHIKTLCDIDENLFGERIKHLQDRYKYAPATEHDMRRVFDDKDIDAVSMATPNHWHALGTIWACQAQKPTYVEKPSCHNIWEGRQMVHAARKYKVPVQVGFQNRSRPNTRAAMKFLHDGKLGKIFMVRGLCFKPRPNIGTYPDGPMPEGSQYRLTVGGTPLPPYTKEYLDKVHYDLWVGPAPKKPFNPNRFHYNWHWQWNYGNGDTGNQGPHQFDVGRWGLGKEEYPVRVASKGGYFIYDNSMQETPNTQTTLLEYEDGTIFEFATRGLPTNKAGGIKIGNIFYGSEGRLELDADGDWRTFLGPKDEPGPDSSGIKSEEADARNTVGSGMGGHFGNFISVVRSRRAEDLNCDIEVGYRSSVLPHLGNIAYLVGHELRFNGQRERFMGDAKANRLIKRRYRRGYVVPRIG